MLVSKRLLLVFSVLMTVIGLSVCAYGYLAKPVVIQSLMSEELVFLPGRKTRSIHLPVPQYDVILLELSSNYTMTVYVHFQGLTYKLASNVTYLDTRFTIVALGANTTERWAFIDFVFEPSRTPCAMRLSLAFEESYPPLGLYFSALGAWFLAVGIGSPCYLLLSKRLKESATRISLKSILIVAYLWAFFFTYNVFLIPDPLGPFYIAPFYVAPFMRGLMLVLFAMCTLIMFTVFGVVLFYHLLVKISFSIKLGFLFLFGFPLLIALFYLVYVHALRQAGIPIFLFVVSYGALYALQARSEKISSKPWLLPFLLGWMFVLTIYSPIHELGHYLVAYFDEATVEGVTWWWITESGFQKPNILIDPASFSSTHVYVLCNLAGLLIILVPFAVLFFIWRSKRSRWWHFSYIPIASSFILSFDDLYNVGFVAQGPLLAFCLAGVSVLATVLLFFWYFYKKLPSTIHKK